MTTAHTSPEDRLDDLRLGRTSELDIDDVNWSDQAEEIIDALKHAPKVTHIKARWMKPEYLPALTQALQNLPKLVQLDLSYSKMQPEDVCALLPALKHMPKLESLLLDDIHIGDMAMEKLSEVIRDAMPALRVVKFNGAGMGDTGAAALFESLRNKPNLQILDFRNNRFGDASLGHLAAMMRNKHQLMGLYLNNTGFSPGVQPHLEQALIQSGSSNLTHLWMDGKSPIAGSFCDHNAKEMRAIAERIGNLTAENPLAPQEIWQYEARKIAAQYQRREIHHENYDRFVDSLPHPPHPVKLDYLFADSKGYTALDNPRTWQEYPDLLDRLAENGELTIEALNRRSTLGVSLLESAVGFAKNAADVFRTVNGHGITLDASQFINTKGEPTPLMETLINRWECGALMQPKNWEGQNRSGIQAVINAIPEAQLAMVPNRHAFMASLRAGSQTAREV